MRACSGDSVPQRQPAGDGKFCSAPMAPCKADSGAGTTGGRSPARLAALEREAGPVDMLARASRNAVNDRQEGRHQPRAQHATNSSVEATELVREARAALDDRAQLKIGRTSR